MTSLPATPSQMVQSKLVNRQPVPCAVCNRYVGPFSGLPVILDAKDGIIGFVHPSCCVLEERTCDADATVCLYRTPFAGIRIDDEQRHLPLEMRN